MYHFIGIKGSGMSALAQIMKSIGCNVEGSDVSSYFFTEDGLKKLNINVHEFDSKNIKKDMIIIKGNAFDENNVEVKECNKLNIKMHSYQELLSKLTRMFDTIAVCGTHGKTTTTSLITHVFKDNLDASFLIGDGRGSADIFNKYFIIEACEYKRHFLKYYPTYVIITNIELDHVDYYKSIEDLIDAYQEFGDKATKKVIAYGDDLNIKKLNFNNIITYGINDSNDVVAKNIVYSKEGINFDVKIFDSFYGNFNLPIYGKHMILNVLACITICYLEGISKDNIELSLKSFNGAKRRFNEYVIGDTILIDDYAHHPTEINALIDSVKQKYPDKKMIGVFEPHTFSRTKKFSKEIGIALNKLDYNFIMDIHPSRELQSDYPDITKYTLMQSLDNCDSIDLNEAEKLVKYKNCVILFMSPNDISVLENDFKKILEL